MAVEAARHTSVSLVACLFGAAVVAQIGYPLTSGGARDSLTVATVLLVAAASIVHAYLSRGARACAVLVLVTVLGGFAVEVLGVHTGVPFGDYLYTGGLGASAFGVPIVVAFAWPMLAWPAALAARRLCRSFGGRVAVGAWALAAWDLFLDPQMVAAGHWTWSHPNPHLPGVPDVPLTNYAGWLVVSVVMSVALQAVVGRGGVDDRWPLAFYVWTWASSALALAAFLGQPMAALWTAAALGVVAVPLARSLWR
jgi:putative membrane protein